MSDTTITPNDVASTTPPAEPAPAADTSVQDGAAPATVADDQAQATSADTPPAETKTFDADYVEKLRKESAKYRTERKAESERAEALETKMNSIIDGLKGLTGDKPEAQNPEDIIAAITAERDQATTQLNQFRIDQAVTKAAADAGADTELATLVLKGKGALNDLDPTASDFAEQVSALVAAEVEANPKLKAVQGAPKSSGSAPEDSTSPRNGQLTRDDMRKMSAREINEAVRAGRFRDVLGG